MYLKYTLRENKSIAKLNETHNIASKRVKKKKKKELLSLKFPSALVSVEFNF